MLSGRPAGVPYGPPLLASGAGAGHNRRMNRTETLTAMSTDDLAAALQRVETVLRRRPDMGLHDDAPATAKWERGTRVVARHANGTTLPTDMPGELGGTGDKVTPGWLFRAGLASCAATSIVMAAAMKGISLSVLEVRATSRSDTRGVLGMKEFDGTPVGAGPIDLKLHVRIAAHGVDPAALRALVDDGCRCSPIPNAVLAPNALDVRVDVDAG